MRRAVPSLTRPAGSEGVATTGPYRRIADTYYGFVTATQVANTYANSARPPWCAERAADRNRAHTSIPYYNMYVTDTWHAKPSLSLNYGLSYAIEMPPSERDGNQVMFTDISGNAIRIQTYLNNRQTAALAGQVLSNPEIGFALLKNVGGLDAITPTTRTTLHSARRAALLCWNPKSRNPSRWLKIFGRRRQTGHPRADTSRIYAGSSDHDGASQVQPGAFILATQCTIRPPKRSMDQRSTKPTSTKLLPVWHGRLGPALTTRLARETAQPYHPGFDGPAYRPPHR